MKKIDIALYKEIGKIIKKIRNSKKISLDTLADKIGNVKTKSTLKRYEDGASRIDIDTLQLICDALNADYSKIIAEAESKVKFSDLSTLNNIYSITTQRIPLLGSVACGQPIFADEDRESYVMVGTDIKADFCLIAKGDSMIEARILDGDIVFVRKQSSVENGEIAVVLINDEATLKRVYYFKEKNMLILKACNSKYEDMIFLNEELENIIIIGKAIFFQSDVD